LRHALQREQRDVIRPLIWIGAGLVMFVILYNVFDRYRAHDALVRAEARQVAGIADPAVKGTKPATVAARSAETLGPGATPNVAMSAPEAPLAPTPTIAPTPSPTPTPGRADSSRGIGRGLSFALADASSVPARVAHLACHGEPAPLDHPHRGSCNPYEGDTSCRTVLPIACYRSSGAAAPPSLEQDFYKGWTHGQLGATQPIMGAIFKSEAEASARCEAELGAGWRMAEFHDGGGGWGLQGERGVGLRAGTRYWVHVNDQRGNCWNSPPG
jgi:hypothetical protein